MPHKTADCMIRQAGGVIQARNSSSRGALHADRPKMAACRLLLRPANLRQNSQSRSKAAYRRGNGIVMSVSELVKVRQDRQQLLVSDSRHNAVPSVTAGIRREYGANKAHRWPEDRHERVEKEDKNIHGRELPGQLV